MGLAPDAVRAYRLLLRLPTASVGELAAGLNMSIVEARAALRGLEAKGLVGHLPGTGHRFQAAPPEQALGPLVRRRHRELRTIRDDVRQLRREYGDGAAEALPVVDVVTGATRLQAHTDRVLAGALAQVCLVAAGPLAGLDDVPAGVQVRAIYPSSVLARASAGTQIAAQLRAGARAHVADVPPADMLVIDRSVAVLPIDGSATDPRQPSAVLIRHGGLHDTLLALFERAWALATPLRVDADGRLATDPDTPVPTSGDLRLLSLLVAGLTDQAIAGRLGVGVRTVQRRVRDLSDLVGARTRLQLVWRAGQRGWI